MKAAIFTLIAIFIGLNIASGQIQIYPGPGVTDDEMVENIAGDGITWSNVTFLGADSARGIFSNGQTTNLGFDNGIFLTTGAGYIIPGPNQSASAGVDNGIIYPWPPPWGQSYDPAILDFDFIPDSDTLRLKYVFGSEEYNEWVGASYNDVFFMLISGPNPNGGQYNEKNIAIVPGTTNTSVKINSVNNGYSPPGVIPTGPCTNCAYYDDNTGGLTLEYDGFTVVLTAFLLVTPCETYHAKFGVVDEGDGLYDTGIFIEENSFSSSAEIDVNIVLDPPGLTENLVEGHVEGDLVFKLPNTSFAPVTICFEIAGTALNSIDYEEIPNCVTFEQGQDSASIHINPFLDGLIEGEETIILIVENTLGCIVKYDTVEVTILDYVDMVSIISPNTMICSDDETAVWVNVVLGFPPYTYLWEPGSFTTDTIIVSPEETTTYTVFYQDIFLDDTGSNSTTITVAPDYLNEIFSFSFETAYNPVLNEDIEGEIGNDSVFLLLPAGTLANNLVATFTLSNCAAAWVNGTEQVSGMTPNDFTFPVTYQVEAQNGDIKEWTVVVEIETGLNENPEGYFSITPNPSDGRFRIAIADEISDPVRIEVLDLVGNIV
ncbi:MAG: hypothetical protein FJY07_02925, partial [Bacteroidetes bacterium]|nr:hypothetical protein [Bacteroidota bacterium]